MRRSWASARATRGCSWSFDGRYKMIHAEGGFRPMLFDLQTDPHEFDDLGGSPDHGAVIDRHV